MVPSKDPWVHFVPDGAENEAAKGLQVVALWQDPAFAVHRKHLCPHHPNLHQFQFYCSLLLDLRPTGL